jgi:hypothetical protein
MFDPSEYKDARFNLEGSSLWGNLILKIVKKLQIHSGVSSIGLASLYSGE